MRVPWLIVGLLTGLFIEGLLTLATSPWPQYRRLLLTVGIALLAGLVVDLLDRRHWRFQLGELIVVLAISAVVITLFQHGCPSGLRTYG